MTFYTADLHLGHANIIRHCGRPFSSAGEMDEALIRNWNRVVGEEDLVCILGDLICYSKRRPEEYLARLRGRKLLVVGNHDDAWMQRVELLDYFQAVVDQTVVRTAAPWSICVTTLSWTGGGCGRTISSTGTFTTTPTWIPGPPSGPARCCSTRGWRSTATRPPLWGSWCMPIGPSKHLARPGLI